MAEPLISIIVPCYNYGKFLAEGLRSIGDQTYRNWECIIVDDGSNDNTKDVASSFTHDTRFKYVYQNNQGLSAARNTGIRSAAGHWIHFMDADDVIHPRKFRVMIDAAELNPSATIVYNDYQFFEASDIQRTLESFQKKFDEKQIQTEVILPIDAALKFIKTNFLATNGPMISSNLIQQTGFFDTTFRSLEDWDYWFRLAINGGVFLHVISPVTLSWMRRHGNNMSKNYSTMLSSHEQLLNKMTSLGKKISDQGLFISTMKRDTKFFPGSIIFEEIQGRKFLKGIGWAFSAVVKHPAHFGWYLEHGLYSIKVRLVKVI